VKSQRQRRYNWTIRSFWGESFTRKGTHFEQDNIKLAIEEYLRSKAALEEAGSRRDLVYVLSELGTLHIYAADYLKAEQYSQESLALAESLKNSQEAVGAMPDEYGLAFAWSNLGQVAQWKGDYDTALDNFKKALAFRRIPGTSLRDSWGA
jgi:tetratricopeptide (TPR) repeat protein